MAEQVNSPGEREPFYVGYLPLPKPIRRFLVPWLAGNFALLVGVAVIIATQQRAPGEGTWETGRAVSIRGWLQREPYPLLHGDDGTTYLLVEQGKIGVQERVASVDHDAVQVEGYVIEREGRHVLEIDGALSAPITTTRSLYAIASPHAPFDEAWPMPADDLGVHTLRGEIVDPKCYLGAMKPGDGKTHKVCATLCITGGIPPMFVVSNTDGGAAAYLLTDADGNAFPESHYGYIADPIELTGRVLRDGDLLILRADLSTIKRLGGER